MIRALLLCLLLFAAPTVQAQVPFEEAQHDVGNVGLTMTNAGFIGRSNVRNTPTGAPSFEYPLNSGVEHLFEAGLWIGAVQRSTGRITVRSGAITSGGGYSAGAGGYEMNPIAPITRRSSLPSSPFFFPGATSHEDLTTAYTDTFRVVPGTQTPVSGFGERLGLRVDQRSYAYSFPFAETFVIVTFDITNFSESALDSIYVGLYHDLVVRNVNTTTDAGGAFFNKGGLGYLDSLYTSYAFNAGGAEPTINTYGAISYLGGSYTDPQTGQTLFAVPSNDDLFDAAGLPTPGVTPRWWLFSGATDPDLSRPTDDLDRYTRMGVPFPDSTQYASQGAYQTALANWYETLRTGGQTGQGNWLGLTSVGPFRTLEPGQSMSATFAFVAARKPDEFQNDAGKVVDTPESRSLLVDNIGWARRTFGGEDRDYDGVLDPGEDVNGNGELDRFLIPEPPDAPNVRVELDAGQVTVYWDRTAERSRDPVTGERDFEGYSIYRSVLGSDRGGDPLGDAILAATFDRDGNDAGFNTGFEAIELETPRTFAGDTTQYAYAYTFDGLNSGWQYGVSVTAFDIGDAAVGLPQFESSRVANAVRVFPGTPAREGDEMNVGVYPNPYRVNASWDGAGTRDRKLYFYNLPPRAEIRIYTTAGEIVDRFDHDSGSYSGDIRWFDTFSGPERVVAGGEHAWDVLSNANLNVATGLYLYSVRDLDTGRVQTGRFALIK
jgi:hypothetical protein